MFSAELVNFVCRQNNWKCYGEILINFSGNIDNGTRNFILVVICSTIWIQEFLEGLRYKAIFSIRVYTSIINGIRMLDKTIGQSHNKIRNIPKFYQDPSKIATTVTMIQNMKKRGRNKLPGYSNTTGQIFLQK